MHIHSASCLEGPITKKRSWWHAAEAAAEDKTLFRAGLVAQIRREIAAGAYETPEKWEAALNRMLSTFH